MLDLWVDEASLVEYDEMTFEMFIFSPGALIYLNVSGVGEPDYRKVYEIPLNWVIV